jgi:hypothetical protein
MGFPERQVSAGVLTMPARGRVVRIGRARMFFSSRRRVQALNRLASCRDLTLERKGEMPMANVWQWMGVGFGLGVLALGLSAFFRGLSLPPNPPEHRSHGGKGEDWRT